MKFTIENSILTASLTELFRVVPSKTAIPILSNFLMELNNGILRITASDGEIALRTLIRPDETDDKGSTTVPARTLLDLLKALPSGPVTLEVKENAMRISWANGNSALPVFDPEDYIKISVPKDEEKKSFTVTSDTLAKNIQKTLIFASHDEARPNLCGIFFDLQPEESHIVASDAVKLACSDFPTPEVKEPSSFILPTKAASVLKATLPKEVPVTVVYDNGNARFAFGNSELTTRLVLGKYPNYATIIPKSNKNVLTVNRELFNNALRRMSVLADKQVTLVKITLSYNKMTINAEDLGYATKGEENVECVYDGNDMTIGLKATTMTEVISSIESSEIEIRFQDARHAVLILPTGKDGNDEKYKAITMPHQIK